MFIWGKISIILKLGRMSIFLRNRCIVQCIFWDSFYAHDITSAPSCIEEAINLDLRIIGDEFQPISLLLLSKTNCPNFPLGPRIQWEYHFQWLPSRKTRLAVFFEDMVASWYNMGVQKLSQRLQKLIDRNGIYV
jgi:hypothetical protein